MADKIQLRRDLAANWTSTNPVLAQGEPAIELDNLNSGGTLRIKVGDGTTAYNSLPYEFEFDATAGSISVVPGGNLSSTDVQAALLELQSDIDTLTGGAITDHGALSGLGDDDHTQYLTEARHDNLPQDNPHGVTAAQTGAETTAQLNARDTANRNRANHSGTQTAATISDFAAAVQAAQSITSLTLAGNLLTFTNENSVSNSIDLSVYIDDTNLARLVSATLDPSGIATFTRDDSTTFTLDLSNLANSQSVYEVYQTGTTTIGSTYTIIPMNTVESPQTNYAVSGGGVQVATAGRYKITYSMSGDSTDGDRAVSQSAIHINAIELVRSKAFAYHRNVATGEGTANKTIITNLNANDVITLRSLLLGDNVTTVDQASNLIVEKIG